MLPDIPAPTADIPPPPVPGAAALPADMRILFVDDDDICAMSFGRVLRKAGITNPLHRARDGEQALGILRASLQPDGTQLPHLILLDLNMPGMGGIEFLECVSRDAALRDHPVLVMTTPDLPRDLLAGFDDLIRALVFKDDPARSLALALTQLDFPPSD